MKRSLTYHQFIGFVFTAVIGTLLHFLYDLTGRSQIVAAFSAVNESIWEHMKLLVFPMFIYAVIEWRVLKGEYGNFWCAKLVGILSGLIIIPASYYTYTGMFGVNADWFNIAIFFLAAALSYWIENRILKEYKKCANGSAAFVILCLIAIVFIVFTFATPQIPLFQDPITSAYGIS